MSSMSNCVSNGYYAKTKVFSFADSNNYGAPISSLYKLNATNDDMSLEIPNNIPKPINIKMTCSINSNAIMIYAVSGSGNAINTFTNTLPLSCDK